MVIQFHNLPMGVEPWDHSRKRRLSLHVPLYEWRIHQYLEAFTRHFEIVKHYCASWEGKFLLTQEVLAYLPDYTTDELTIRSYVIDT
jgi:hypothetical protein